MVVMVRLADDEAPLNREEYAGTQLVKLAGMLCRDKDFWRFLNEEGLLFDMNETECIGFLQSYLCINSRSDIKTNLEAQNAFKKLYAQYKEWKNV
jgi:hypothetical protein